MGGGFRAGLLIRDALRVIVHGVQVLVARVCRPAFRHLVSTVCVSPHSAALIPVAPPRSAVAVGSLSVVSLRGRRRAGGMAGRRRRPAYVHIDPRDDPSTLAPTFFEDPATYVPKPNPSKLFNEIAADAACCGLPPGCGRPPSLFNFRLILRPLKPLLPLQPPGASSNGVCSPTRSGRRRI